MLDSYLFFFHTYHINMLPKNSSSSCTSAGVHRSFYLPLIGLYIISVEVSFSNIVDNNKIIIVHSIFYLGMHGQY